MLDSHPALFYARIRRNVLVVFAVLALIVWVKAMACFLVENGGASLV